MEILKISQNSLDYPPLLKRLLDKHAPDSFDAFGNFATLQTKTLALFCSQKCPGNLILQTYDLAQNLRQAGITVIGGFHSPMEREVLNILLRGAQPIIICLARNISAKIGRDYSPLLKENRALILSPFDRKNPRITAETSVVRNRFVAALATHIFVAYAEPRGKMEQFCRDVLVWGKPLYTFADDANEQLVALGAKAVPANWVP